MEEMVKVNFYQSYEDIKKNSGLDTNKYNDIIDLVINTNSSRYKLAASETKEKFKKCTP